MKMWVSICLFWFGIGCVMGLVTLEKEPEPRPFPPGYGRSPVQYFEPTAANEHRFDI